MSVLCLGMGMALLVIVPFATLELAWHRRLDHESLRIVLFLALLGGFASVIHGLSELS